MMNKQKLNDRISKLEKLLKNESGYRKFAVDSIQSDLDEMDDLISNLAANVDDVDDPRLSTAFERLVRAFDNMQKTASSLN